MVTGRRSLRRTRHGAGGCKEVRMSITDDDGREGVADGGAEGVPGEHDGGADGAADEQEGVADGGAEGVPGEHDGGADGPAE